MGKLSTPPPTPADIDRSENLHGAGNINNSVTGGKHNEVNDYSVDLNFILLHLNTLASTE